MFAHSAWVSMYNPRYDYSDVPSLRRVSKRRRRSMRVVGKECGPTLRYPCLRERFLVITEKKRKGKKADLLRLSMALSELALSLLERVRPT